MGKRERERERERNRERERERKREQNIWRKEVDGKIVRESSAVGKVQCRREKGIFFITTGFEGGRVSMRAKWREREE